jgi:DNA segregation ATPase FtsK/SpoIIIE, S-DNA-T family
MTIHEAYDTDEDVVPRALRRFMHHRILEIVGLVTLAAIALVGLALLTWHVDDPSLTHATRTAARNWLGWPGAIVADELLQKFGLASLVVLAVPFMWTISCFQHQRLTHMWSSLLFWLAAILALSVTASFLPTGASWPLNAGLGGITGDVLAGNLVGLFSLALKGAFAKALVFCASLLFGLWSFIRASGSGSERFAHIIGSSARHILGRCATIVWTALTAFFRTLSRIGMPRLPSIPNLSSGRERKALQSASGEKDRNIIERLAPTRADGRKIRIEPALLKRNSSVEPFDEPDTESPGSIEHVNEAPAPGKAKAAPRTSGKKPRKVSDDFELPDLELLSEPKKLGRAAEVSAEVLAENAEALEGVLDDFSVKGQIIDVKPGPVVTLYELEPAPGIKSSRVISLADDIARSMSAISARVAVVPGRNAIGIELPNAKRETVYLRELFESSAFQKSTQGLCLALGKNIGGEPVYADLARMPHLLIAGTTGSGKSVGINTMILSLLYRLSPERCRLIMIDPKMLELSVYEGIPHLLAPVVTDPRKAVVALKWAVREMEDRYKKMSKIGVRNVDGFNARMTELIEKGEKLTRTVQTGFDPASGQPVFETDEQEPKTIPYIVVIIDEMADLMMVAGKDIEGAVQRLAQMARAAGIHVIMATQRPSVDVITGTIKANFPTRVSFQVTSRIDSRTILGEQGAEQLLGQGDMLYMAGGGRISRLHAPFVSDSEVEAIVSHLKLQATPEYVDAVTEEEEDAAVADLLDGTAGAGGGSGDQLYDQAVAVVLRDKKVSTSYVQRRLQIGYNKAASLIERMEKEGVISSANATGKREILVPGDSAND